MAASSDTVQCERFIQAGACSPGVARILGLLFADRDVEMIEYLKTLTELPAHEDFPSAEKVVAALGVEPRWAVFELEKMHRFLRKRELNGDFTSEIKNFSDRPDVQALVPACQKLPVGPTVFIGDSLMDIRHFGANASFPILVGGFLEGLGRGPFVNAGIGGETSAQGLKRFEKDALAHRPVRIVFSFGSNDLSNGVSIESICHNFELMIRPALAMGATVVLGAFLPFIIERLWWSTEPLKGTALDDRRALQRAMNALADRYHLRCFNLLDVFTAEYYSVDGIHINQSGQERMGVETLRLLVA